METARLRINEIDGEMANLFVKRMECVRDIAEYKLEHGISITDEEREKRMIEANSSLVNDEVREYYVDFLKAAIKVSKAYQKSISENADR